MIILFFIANMNKRLFHLTIFLNWIQFLVCNFNSIYFYWILSLFLRFIYLFLLQSQTYREEERQRKIFNLMIHSPSDCNDWYCANLGAKNFLQVSHVGVDPKALGHPGLLSQATCRELDGKWGFRDRTGTTMGFQAHSRLGL